MGLGRGLAGANARVHGGAERDQRRCANYCGSDREGFFNDRMRQDATLRKLEVIGQAVTNLSEGTKSRQPDIPWKQIAGMRDKVIHDYFGVNLEIVWAVVQKELPTRSAPTRCAHD